MLFPFMHSCTLSCEIYSYCKLIVYGCWNRHVSTAQFMFTLHLLTGKKSEVPTSEFRETIAKKLRHKWRQIGIYLNIDHTELDQIAHECKGDDSRCSSELFRKWTALEVSTSCPFTWKALNETLDNDAVKESSLSQCLKSKQLWQNDCAMFTSIMTMHCRLFVVCNRFKFQILIHSIVYYMLDVVCVYVGVCECACVRVCVCVHYISCYVATLSLCTQTTYTYMYSHSLLLTLCRKNGVYNKVS